jgi:hypothetical protein
VPVDLNGLEVIREESKAGREGYPAPSTATEG